MRRELIQECICLIEGKAQRHGRSLSTSEAQLWGAVFAPMDDRLGWEALQAIILNSHYAPDFSDVRREYAELIGAAPGESPDQAVARQQRQAQERERLARERDQFREECRQNYGRIMADPVLRAEWFRSHSSRNLPFADVIDGAGEAETERR